MVRVCHSFVLTICPTQYERASIVGTTTTVIATGTEI